MVTMAHGPPDWTSPKSVHQPSDRNMQNIPGHHDETHLHGKGDEFPESFSPCLNRLVGSGPKSNFWFEPPDESKDIGNKAQNDDDHYGIWDPSLRPTGEGITPVFQELERSSDFLLLFWFIENSSFLK
jgi:hypothetical protein